MINKKILLTAGDPNGIGPEIILKGFEPKQYPDFLVLGSEKVFTFYQNLLNLRVDLNFIHSKEEITTQFNPNCLNILDHHYDSEVEPGKLTQQAGHLSLQLIDTAINLIKSGYSCKMVTAPISKEAIIMNHPDFIGHTEYLAAAYENSKVSMALLSNKINVALVTTHMSLKDVPKVLNKEMVLTTLKNCDHFFKQISLMQGKIAVCSLNPHMGEGGHFGDEEETILEPAIKEAQDLGINVSGPFSADTLFCNVHSGRYDLYVAIYHDQGLIPFKLLSFNSGVNTTLGLPFFRVSVDHGTAFNIAGKGKADAGSMKTAIAWAYKPKVTMCC